MYKLASTVVLLCAMVTTVLGAEVVVPDAGKTTTIYEGETVRITGTGIAGGTVDIDVVGPSKGKETKNTVVHRAGALNRIGGMTKEVEFTPKKGTITVKVTVKGPVGGKAEVTEYTLEVKEKVKE